MTTEELIAIMTECDDCKVAPPADIIAETIRHDYRKDDPEYATDGRDSFGDGTDVAIFGTADGSGWVYTAENDYTGHGCRCSAELTRFDSIPAAERLGLSDDQRDRLGIPHPTEPEATR